MKWEKWSYDLWIWWLVGKKLLQHYSLQKGWNSNSNCILSVVHSIAQFLFPKVGGHFEQWREATAYTYNNIIILPLFIDNWRWQIYLILLPPPIFSTTMLWCKLGWEKGGWLSHPATFVPKWSLEITDSLFTKLALNCIFYWQDNSLDYRIEKSYLLRKDMILPKCFKSLWQYWMAFEL